ncbi:LysE family translocator [Inmirania thermothiophila]|uniref:Threonine/homoserine/homoserine lactone efflux protein n=1 Tax=Inmirania thermothiophila TaxID=1750597 RepID=A0A3N1Y168_9GAMM|nr:LysE family translocator [Inmirania thermothiophila]ROR32573.1 threonine/homoserine/homoserine lactone efflux protein [Inmirania thermothiophila]
MPDPAALLAFFAASVLLALAPGPDNLFVLAQSAQHGARAGLLVTLGLCTGLLVHTGAVALGLAALLAASTAAFTALKLAGAAYLLWLAWQAWHAAHPAATPALAGPRRRALYLRGIVMNVTNPKVTLFFLAFLPQFADPARGPVAPQVLALGALFILATILVFGAVALLAGGIGAWLRRTPRAGLALNRLSALLFAGLALRLATAR